MPEVRLITPITRQSTKKMQVAAYCRVSSNSADQLNSYAAQIRAYKKCIGARDDWELVDIFADEGLTGMKSETRDEFQRMIRMCELKQIDLIITKSISRFARNTKDALAYLAPEVYQAQANEISAELAKLKDVRQEKFNSKAAIMLEEVKKLKMLIFELEEPLDAFDEKLFLEIVKSIQINKEDEMSVELLGGLRFRERI